MFNLNEEIGIRIADLRKSRHLTQAQLSEMLNISIKHCSCVERGVASFSIDLLIKICDIFDTNLDYLIRGKEPEGMDALPAEFLAYVKNADAKELALIREYMELYLRLRG